MWMKCHSLPRMDVLDKIADLFNISVSDLLEDKQNKPTYYLNDETRKIAQEIYENPDLRILFYASKNATPEDLKFVTEMVKRMNHLPEE